ncbi:MAG: hypothetical protein ONB48_10250 [candidate division KSB1 bacterium]|nr:hypothetical protein [candidate division KSB1 bacterium]MDZ7273869.1 hypothetical protein [candidate division KSB1 bacterium]MDZ7286025.1 hypothetical protein [candidate division KSB1 bacterium]MDZ7299057.1 hypothetical protein [candidate division KSB1 bacterium]MDZ7308194.1 hypothetical protein [candidate division KSB1 bacterium]
MRAEEIICLAILPEEVAAGIAYACRSLHHTFDRMNYGADAGRRFNKIATGKACEATLTRFLRRHGIPHLSCEGETPHTQPDHFDLRILNEVVDLKTFHLPEAVARPAAMLACLALVPSQNGHDQWGRRHRYQRYVFAFSRGRLRGHLALAAGPARLRPEAVRLTSAPTHLFVAAAPTIAECERHFRRVAAGTICPQYPRGTRIENHGCEIAHLTSFQSFLDNLEKFQRR